MYTITVCRVALNFVNLRVLIQCVTRVQNVRDGKCDIFKYICGFMTVTAFQHRLHNRSEQPYKIHVLLL